jgi:hypothetical protein
MEQPPSLCMLPLLMLLLSARPALHVRISKWKELCREAASAAVT